MSKIEAKRSLEQGSRGTRLMIIELRKYNEIRELLIENRTAGLQAQVSYQDMFREASVTRAAVRKGVKEMGIRTRCRGTCNQPPSWGLDQGHVQTPRNN